MGHISVKEFEGLSPAKKRVLIARDVLEQLELKKIIASKGNYFKSQQIEGILENTDQSVQLQTLLELPEVQCEVCAKGSLFVADVLRRNNFKVNSYQSLNDNDVTLQKLEYFSKNQLDLIEMAFEGYNVHDNPLYFLDEVNGIGDEAIDFYNETFYNYNLSTYSKKSEDLMIRIMKNIIKYRGTFRPNGVDVRVKKTKK